MYLSDVGRTVESKDCACDVEGDALGHASDVLVECAAHVVVVAKDECLLWVETDGDDVCCVCACVALHLLDGALLAEEELLVVGHHDDKWYVEDILQPPWEVLASSFISHQPGRTHLVNANGTVCPMCIESLLGPRPV